MTALSGEIDKKFGEVTTNSNGLAENTIYVILRILFVFTTNAESCIKSESDFNTLYEESQDTLEPTRKHSSPDEIEFQILDNSLPPSWIQTPVHSHLC